MSTMDFPDASFDLVLLMFGVVVAAEPAAMAAELVRVCRPAAYSR